MQSVYNGKVRLLPCDGDVHSLFYRKDLFEEFSINVPRTWDEYTEVAKFFHGREVPVPGTNETVTLTGSCVERKLSCHEGGYFNMLVHSTSTQALGTETGALLNPDDFEPLMGEAMAETLRHLENQAKYGNPEDELTGDGCNGINFGRISEGKCAMTYFWGDIFARHLIPPALLEGRLGIAPTPGVSKVLDRTSGKMVACTPETCPHGEKGEINRAPYAAAGGWSAGVAGGVSQDRQDAMAEFFGYVCGQEQSLDDVIPEARGTLFTGTDPYRASQFDIEKWVERGYPRQQTLEYQETIESQLGSPNTVLDVRFPEANAMLSAMNKHIFEHLSGSLTQEKTHEERLAVADAIAEEWRAITREYDSRPTTILPLKSVYQQSLNVYVPPSPSQIDGSSLETGAIAGIVVGCSLVAALVTGIVFNFLVKREKQKSRQNWQIRKEDIRIQGEVLGEGAFGVILKGTIRGTTVAVKPSRHNVDSVSGEISGSSGTSNSQKLTQRQMEEELASLVKLRHPHIVQIIGAFVDKKSVLVVTEFMEHGSLSR